MYFDIPVWFLSLPWKFSTPIKEIEDRQPIYLFVSILYPLLIHFLSKPIVWLGFAIPSCLSDTYDQIRKTDLRRKAHFIIRTVSKASPLSLPVRYGKQRKQALFLFHFAYDKTQTKAWTLSTIWLRVSSLAKEYRMEFLRLIWYLRLKPLRKTIREEL